MGFLHKAISTLFYPAVAAGKVISSTGKKVESSFDSIINTIAIFFETSLGVLVIGGMTVVLLLAKNPRLALLAI